MPVINILAKVENFKNIPMKLSVGRQADIR